MNQQVFDENMMSAHAVLLDEVMSEIDIWFDVVFERCRQVVDLGYTPEQDDVFVNDELAALAAIYAMPPGARDWPAMETGLGETFGAALLPDGWIAKTGDRDDELVKSVALILAELARRRRAALRRGAE